MSSNSQEKIPKEKFKSKIGGQAVIEGVMMRGIDKASMANRMPDGTIDLEIWDIKTGNAWYRKCPFVRGIFSFVTSMIDGYKCITRSADKQMTDDDEEELTKFEVWLNDKLGDKMMPVFSGIAMVLGIVLAMFLFMWVPTALIGVIDKYVIALPYVVKNIIEGLLKIAIFIGYTSATSLMKDMRRLYEYHGAEHKTIACYEHGEELTPENVKKFTRFHPRCGTSFIFLVLFISILVNTVFHIGWGNKMVRVAIKLALLPLVTGIAYELIRLAGRYDNAATRIISAPGLWIQRITTREPDKEEMECAISALKAVIPENKEDDVW